MPTLINKVIHVDNRVTSIRLAEAEWDALELIARQENIKKTQLLRLIDNNRNAKMCFTAAVRLFALIYLHDWLEDTRHPNYQSSKIKPMSPIFKAIKGIL